jgi:hypothetical protein
MAGENTVSQVQPDGSVTGLNPEPNADGVRVVDGADHSRAAEVSAEDALDKRLNEIFDKHNPDGGHEEKSETTAEAKTDQPRGKDGKFAAKDTGEGADKTAADPDKDAAKTKADGEKGEAPKDKADGQDKPATVAMPRSWSPAEKKMWDALPPEVQKKFADRESEAHTTISRQGQVIAAYRPLGELLAKNREVFARHNAPPMEGVARLIEVQRRLDQDPVTTVAGIIKAYTPKNAHPATFVRAVAHALGAPRIGADGKPIPADPRDQEIAQLRSQITQMSQRLDGRDRQETEVVQHQMAAQQQEVDQSITEWSKDKEFFEHVREDMAHFVESGQADDLDQAYDMACNANPEIRKHLAEKAKADEEAKAKADAEAKAKADKEAREKAASEARRTGRIQLDGTQHAGSRTTGGKRWNDNSYLEDLYDRVSSGAS